MSEISIKDFMKDSKGRLVPMSMIREIDMARNELVLELVKKARDLQEAMKKFRNSTLDDVLAFVDLSAERYDVHLGGNKGNLSLVSYDGAYKVQVAIQENVSFDEGLQAAKTLIDECITEWTEGMRNEVRALINDAFQVDKEGKISTTRILGLRRLNISNERWLQAMQAIADSLQVVSSKTYLRIYERGGTEGKWVPISLDLAAL